jgi:hypothetical protein
MPPWSMIKPDDIDVVAPDGTVRCRVKGHYAGSQFVIDDMSADVQEGDEIRRLLPNGKEDVFRVVDPKFYDGMFGKHYQVTIVRKGSFPLHTGGHYLHVTGANSRVNINSTDNSTNIIAGGNVFGDVREAVRRNVSDDTVRAELERLIDHLEQAKDKRTFTTSFQGLIAGAGQFVSVLAPFLPGLTQLLTHLPG